MGQNPVAAPIRVDGDVVSRTHDRKNLPTHVQERLRPEPAASVLDLVDVLEKHGEYGFAHARLGAPNRVRTNSLRSRRRERTTLGLQGSPRVTLTGTQHRSSSSSSSFEAPPHRAGSPEPVQEHFR